MAYKNGYKEGLTIDRINNYEGYSPNNCRWINNLKQQNNRRNNIFLECREEKLTISELSRKYNIPYSTMYDWVRKRQLTFNQILEKLSAR